MTQLLEKAFAEVTKLSDEIHDSFALQLLERLSSEVPPSDFAVTLEQDEDGIWIAECPALLGCVSQGATKEDALTNVKEAIAACLEVRAERGLPLTIGVHQVQAAV